MLSTLIASAGTPRLWPSPSSLELASSDASSVFRIDPCSFSFDVGLGFGDGEAAKAIKIYKPLILRSAGKTPCDEAPRGTAKTLQALALRFDPKAESEEGYGLRIGPNGQQPDATLSAGTYVGLLRGLETFSQLVSADAQRGGALSVRAGVTVQDRPTFEYRGVLIDCARNYMPMDALRRVVDGLMASKMNRLHLHLTDSQSFPLQLSTGHGPNITKHGAYSPAEVYSVADLRALQAYAADRGVEVVPEMDTPGHARAIGNAPGLSGIVSCADVPGANYTDCCAEPPCGQLNPSSSLMYSVLADALGDIAATFAPSRLLHLGFDEVNDNCWARDPTITAYMSAHGLTPAALLKQFFERERKMLQPNRTAVYWDEVVTAGLHTSLQPDDIVQFWHAGDSGLLGQFFKEAAPSNKAILSAYTSYYLDCGTGNEFGNDSWCDPYKTWRTLYFTDPLKGIDAATAHSRVLGGEATLWTEVASPGSLDSKLWPRAAAYGGRLWDYGGGATADWVDVELALAAHATRLAERGIGAGQIMPQFCQKQPHMCFPGK